MHEMKAIGLSLGVSFLSFMAFAVIVEIIRRRLGFDPAARIAGAIDARLPRMAAQGVTS